MYAIILQKKKFCCCCLYNSIKVLEFCRKSWKSPGTLMQKCEKSPRKSWNLNQFFRWDTTFIQKPSYVELFTHTWFVEEWSVHTHP